MKTSKAECNEINLVLGGEAGQGLQTIAQILARMFLNGGLHVVAVSEFRRPQAYATATSQPARKAVTRRARIASIPRAPSPRRSSAR